MENKKENLDEMPINDTKMQKQHDSLYDKLRELELL